MAWSMVSNNVNVLSYTIKKWFMFKTWAIFFYRKFYTCYNEAEVLLKGELLCFHLQKKFVWVLLV